MYCDKAARFGTDCDRRRIGGSESTSGEYVKRSHTIAVRTISVKGEVQTSAVAPLAPNRLDWSVYYFGDGRLRICRV